MKGVLWSMLTCWAATEGKQAGCPTQVCAQGPWGASQDSHTEPARVLLRDRPPWDTCLLPNDPRVVQEPVQDVLK